MRFRSLVILFFLGIIGGRSYAAPLDEVTLKNEVIGMLEGHEKNGISKIDGQDISLIKKKIKSEIQITVVPFLAFKSNSIGSYRSSGHQSPFGKSALLSQDHLEKTDPEKRPYMTFHEISRYVGINDHNLNKTAALKLLKDVDEAVQKNPRILKNTEALKLLKENIESETKDGGGITGVDGGGDFRILSYMGLIQSEMLFDLIDSKISSETYRKAVRKISTIQVEFHGSIHQGNIFYREGMNCELKPESESQCLLIPKNATADPYFDLNLNRLRIFLASLYQSL